MEFRKELPPKAKRDTYQKKLAEVRKRRGSWGKLRTASSPGAANTCAHYLRVQHGESGFEFATRGKDVWGRFTPARRKKAA